MNGYAYFLERNRLMPKLEDGLAYLRDLSAAQRREKTARPRLVFDIRPAALQTGAANEYPGERRNKARPMADPR